MAAAHTELEKLVQRIQQQLAPKAEVLHNVKMRGRSTGSDRQIDVLVREKIGQYEINIILDCKDYKHPVDVKGVEEFYGLLDDVGAQKGVLVCPAGFTANAKIRAKGYQIDLFSPVDTDNHKWQASPTIPALCDFRIASFGFGVSCSAPIPFRIMPTFFSENVVFNPDGISLGTCYETIVARWNSGEMLDNLGVQENVPIFGSTPTLTDNGYGRLCPVDLFASVAVYENLFFGQLPVPQMSGFKDELTGDIITNAFSIGLLDPEEIAEKWLQVDEVSNLPVKPVIRLQGLVCWDQNAGVEIDFRHGEVGTSLKPKPPGGI